MLILKKYDFDFMKSNMELAYGCVIPNTVSVQNDVVNFDVEDYSAFQDMMNFDIINGGMDNQDTVNQLGKKMYQIYDDILNQKNS